MVFFFYDGLHVSRLCQLFRCIVLLVDEYDLPLLTTGSDSAEYYGKFLRSLKDLLQNSFLKYVIMTGCTSINNLKANDADTISDGSLTKELNVIDISTQNEYNAICGYTESEIRKYYSHHINEIMRRHDRTEAVSYTHLTLPTIYSV